MRAGVALTALLTAGEKGDAIVDAAGEGAAAFSVTGAELDAEVMGVLLTALAESCFTGVSTSISAD